MCRQPLTFPQWAHFTDAEGQCDRTAKDMQAVRLKLLIVSVWSQCKMTSCIKPWVHRMMSIELILDGPMIVTMGNMRPPQREAKTSRSPSAGWLQWRSYRWDMSLKSQRRSNFSQTWFLCHFSYHSIQTGWKVMFDSWALLCSSRETCVWDLHTHTRLPTVAPNDVTRARRQHPYVEFFCTVGSGGMTSIFYYFSDWSWKLQD